MADNLSPLLPNQKLFIDAHGHENNSEERSRMIDDPTYDLHIHKKTNPIFKNGKKVFEVEIRIPINNPNREIDVEVKNKDQSTIPGDLRREVKNALKDRTIRETFVKEIADVMKTYPSKVKDNQKKTEDTLRRFSGAFRINELQLKDEWFTHINQDQNGVSMLSFVSNNDERYNVLACDNFIMAEQAEPTKKTIIRLAGASHRGKTEIIKRVYKNLVERFPTNAINIVEADTNNDVKTILFIHGAKVGIESEGDPGYRQPRSIDEFVSMGCDVILVASRKRGPTVDSIEKYKNEYRIVPFYINKIDDSIEQELAKRDMISILTTMVEGKAIEAFAEL